MSTLVVEPTSTAQWLALVSEAETACHCQLDDTLESYLVFLLMRFTKKPDFAGRAMALDYLCGMLASGHMQQEQLRDVGDQCLLLSGFFPQQAERRLVRISYFVQLGQSAYGQLAESIRHAGADLYAGLSAAFVVLMDVLLAIRSLDNSPVLQPLQALELWQDVGSRQARKSLGRLSHELPVSGISNTYQ